MDKMSDDPTNDKDDQRPLPNDFGEYLPWACNQLQVNCIIIINKIYQNEYVGVGQTDRSKGRAKSKSKNEPSKSILNSDENYLDSIGHQSLINTDNVIRINTIYDSSENLIELKFDKNKQIPRIVLKIIGLILPFQNFLTALTINKGLNNGGIYEISKIIPVSIVTDLCLDNTVIAGANYDTLLEKQNAIRQLSLARCNIDDDVVKKIASKLFYPSPSSKSLVILNLASNKITDTGAKYLADVLRTNRQLGYLNLAGNMITDEGAAAILDILKEFPLTCEELISSRSRHMVFLKEKNKLISRMMTELKANDFDKKTMKRKSLRPPTTPGATGRKSKAPEKEGSLKSMAEGGKSLTNFEAVWYEKAKGMADSVVGDFNDPYSSENIYSKDGVVYCYGNNSLSYINLCYNNLSYFTVKKLLSVLKYQKLMDRKPRGLVNVSIEGNCLPICCRELMLIDDLIEMGLMAHCRKLSALSKKRPASKGK